jgi:charged multivesicular body protein 6
LKLQRDKLKQYQKKVLRPSAPVRWCTDVLGTQIQFVLNREQQIAKEQLATGHKDRALLALRRRKYQQGLLERTDGQLHNLEELVSSLLNLNFPG